MQDCRLALSNPPTKIALLMPLLISTSINQKQRWLHNWNQGHWRPSFIIDIPWCMTQLECCTILENSRKNIFQFLSGDLQGRLPKIYLATFPWLFVFKVHVSKRIPKVPFHRPWWPDWYGVTTPSLSAKSVKFQKHSMENQNFAKKVISDLTAFREDKEPFS